MKTNMLDETVALAKKSKIPVTKMCKELGITSRWYYMVLNGQIKDPGIKRIQALHDYLVTKDEQAAA